MSKEIIAKKAAVVDEVTEKFNSAVSCVVVNYRCLLYTSPSPRD